MASQAAETQTYGQRAPLTKPHTDDTKNRPPKGRSGRSGSDRAQSQVQPKTSRRVTTTTSRDRGKTQNTKGMKEALWLRDEGLDSMQVVQRLHQRGRKTVQLVSISPLGRKPLLAARKSWTPVEAGALKILQGHNHIAKLIEPCGITVDSWGIGVMAFFWLTQGGLFGNANRGLKAWKERDPQLLLDIAINKENLSDRLLKHKDAAHIWKFIREILHPCYLARPTPAMLLYNQHWRDKTLLLSLKQQEHV